MRDFYTPADIAVKLGTSPQLVRLGILQGHKGWTDIKYFMCGRNMKIPVKQFDEWFYSTSSRELRKGLAQVRAEGAEGRQPVKVRAIRVKKRGL